MATVEMAVRNERKVFFDESLSARITEVGAFADSIGKRDSFEDALSRVAYPKFFGQTARTFLSVDFAAHSFAFSVQVQDPDGSWKFAMNGGIIFHERDQDWGVHT